MEVRGQGELGHPEERKLLPAWQPVRTDTAALLFGRAVFGGYFIYNGINHVTNTPMMAAYARSKGVPLPTAAVLGTGAMLLAGGLSILFGWRPKVGASLITGFLAAVSPQMHAFWRIEDPQEQMTEMVNFTKNMGLIGGACLASAIPEPWPASVDRALE